MATAQTAPAKFPADITTLGRGKAQKFILAQLHKTQSGRTFPQHTADIARGYRGHLAGLMSAGATLAKRGIITITEPEPGFGQVYTLAAHTHG